MVDHQYDHTSVQKYIASELEKNMLKYTLESEIIFYIYYVKGLHISNALSVSFSNIPTTCRHTFLACSNLTASCMQLWTDVLFELEHKIPRDEVVCVMNILKAWFFCHELLDFLMLQF